MLTARAALVYGTAADSGVPASPGEEQTRTDESLRSEALAGTGPG
jgi:hypothetical protein